MHACSYALGLVVHGKDASDGLADHLTVCGHGKHKNTVKLILTCAFAPNHSPLIQSSSFFSHKVHNGSTCKHTRQLRERVGSLHAGQLGGATLAGHLGHAELRELVLELIELGEESLLALGAQFVCFNFAC